MAALRLSFLGAPEAYRSREILTFRTRKSLALLVYLVVESGFHPREKLTALLWPESDTQRGQMSLRRALASLRKTLGDTITSGQAHLLIQGDRLGFNYDANFEADTRKLDTAAMLAQASKGDEALRSREYIDQLQPIVSLYRGDFLEGFKLRGAYPFDDWAGIHREVYHKKMDLIFECLAQLQFECGQMENALDTGLRWVRHSRFNEAAHRCLMRVRFAAGHRAAALAAFETCKRILLEELALEPAPETQALAERIRAETEPVSSHHARGPRATVPLSAIPGVPFVGRAEEHEKLVARYHTTLLGQAQVVTLVGDAGIGKTRMATEFLQWTASQGAQVLSGRAFETGGQLPYQPWAEILRGRAVRETLSRKVLGDVWLGELSRLLPELLDRYPGISPLKGDESAAQARLIESVARLGQAMAEVAPLVVFVDDLQWADSASLDLLRYVARRWADAGAPIMIILCSRSEALATTPALVEWLTRLDRDILSTRLNLGPLSHPHTRQWVQLLAGEGAESAIVDEFGRWLQAETGGQPFYIAAMFAALIERGILYRKPGESQTIEFRAAVRDIEGLRGFIPPGIREVILARMARLSPDAMTLLSAGAVLGHRFSFELLQGIADLPEEKALAALDQLLARRFFLEQTGDDKQSQDRPFLFAHDKIRDVVYTEAGAARRRIYHRRALDELAEVAAPAGELAHHAFAGGQLEPAFHYSVEAGDEAMTLTAAQEASAHYSRAHELVERGAIDQVASGELIHLYSNLGRALELGGLFQNALAKYEELEALGHRYGDRSIELAALLARVTLLAMPNPVTHPVQAQVLSERALALSRDLDDRAAEAKLLWCLSHVHRLASKMTLAIDAGERSLALARALNLREQMAYTLNDLGSHCYLMSGRIDAAIASLEEAGELWLELGNLPMLVDSLASMALACSFAGEYERVLSLATEAFQISQTTGNLWGQAFSRMQVGSVLWEQGLPDQAIAAMEETIRASEAAGFSVPQALTRADLAAVFGSLGAIERGLETAHLALAAAENSLPHSRRYVLAVSAHLHLLNGNLTEAKVFVERAKAGPHREVFPIFFIRVVQADCELAYCQGDYERAQQISEKWLADLDKYGMSAYLPRAHYLQGQILLALGKHPAAKESLMAARSAAEAIGARQALWSILAALSKIEPAPDKARKLRRQAQEIVADISDNTPVPELRASFLQLEQVRAVLDN